MPGGTLGIAHTRWATHGAPTDAQRASPHRSAGKIALVHNGIIENSRRPPEGAGAARAPLQVRDRHRGAGPPDRASATPGNLEEAVALRPARGRGHLRHRGDPRRRAATRSSPRARGARCWSGSATASTSSPPSVARSSPTPARSSTWTTARWSVLTPRRLPRPRPLGARRIDKPVQRRSTGTWRQIEKGGYAHFMLKEIFEQPETVRNAMRGRLARRGGHSAQLGGLNLTADELQRINRIIITACGTSWHAGADRRVHARGAARASRSRWSTPRSSATATR